MKRLFFLILISILTNFTFAQDSVDIYSEIINNMVLVKGGTFEMGSASGDTDEKPVHVVTLSSFYISKYEVTAKQWYEVMGDKPSYFKNCEQCPVESVSWNDIQEFIKKLNEKTGKKFRLPTEAEWEYAAKGGKYEEDNKLSGSKNIGYVAWFRNNSEGKPQKVGEKQPNILGIYDMTGNVWEWCNDNYKSDYYSISPKENPQGPEKGEKKVLRGGSWNNFAKHSRVTYRITFIPANETYDYGFRLCMSSEQ